MIACDVCAKRGRIAYGREVVIGDLKYHLCEAHAAQWKEALTLLTGLFMNNAKIIEPEHAARLLPGKGQGE